jgi:hypothetical protein
MASEKDAYVISYLDFRRLVGWVAIALPFAVLIGGKVFERIPILDSISQYYYTSMRDVFVGLLCAVGVFLLFFRGVSKQDVILAITVGAAVICIALAPMDPKYSDVITARFPAFNDTVCYVNRGPLKFHDPVSAVFFGLISYMVIFRFPLTKEESITPQKKWRNLIYVVCGVSMAVCVVLIAIQLKRDGSIFWLEEIAIGMFGIAWLAKGQQWPFPRDIESQRTIPVAGLSNRWGWGKGRPRPNLETV